MKCCGSEWGIRTEGRTPLASCQLNNLRGLPKPHQVLPLMSTYLRDMLFFNRPSLKLITWGLLRDRPSHVLSPLTHLKLYRPCFLRCGGFPSWIGGPPGVCQCAVYGGGGDGGGGGATTTPGAASSDNLSSSSSLASLARLCHQLCNVKITALVRIVSDLTEASTRL